MEVVWTEIWSRLVLLYMTYQRIEGASTLSTNRRPVQTLGLQLVCKDSGSITKNVNFYKDGNLQGGCIPGCGSGTGYDVSQSKSESVTYLTMTSVDQTNDAGSWICIQEGSTDSNTLEIPTNLPTFLNESDITTDPAAGSTLTPPQVLVVSMPCASPVPNVTWSYTKDGVKTSISSNDESDPTGCPAGKNKLTSSLNTSSIAGTGIITLTVKVEHDSFNPANNYARLFTFEVNLGATTISPTPPAALYNTTNGDNPTTDEMIIIVSCVVGGLVVVVLVVVVGVLVHKYGKKKVHSQDQKEQAMTTPAEPKRISSNL